MTTATRKKPAARATKKKTAKRASKKRAKPAKYKARENSPLSNEKADVIGRWVEECEAKGETVTHAYMLDQASEKSSPFHSWFNWDDADAANKWRDEQARQYLSGYMTISIKTGESVRGGHSLTRQIVSAGGVSTTERGFVTHKHIVKDPAYMEQLSKTYYYQILGMVREVEGLGLDEHDPKWRLICASVKRHRPRIEC